MKLLFLESLALGLIGTYVKARVVDFALIAFCNTSAQLNINGEKVDLAKETADVPLWKLSHEVGDGALT